MKYARDTTVARTIKVNSYAERAIMSERDR